MRTSVQDTSEHDQPASGQHLGNSYCSQVAKIGAALSCKELQLIRRGFDRSIEVSGPGTWNGTLHGAPVSLISSIEFL